MTRYATPVFIAEGDADFPIAGSGWSAILELDPDLSECNELTHQDGSTTVTYSRRLWLEAGRSEDAAAALRLACLSHCLQEGVLWGDLLASVHVVEETSGAMLRVGMGARVSHPNFQGAVQIAARLSKLMDAASRYAVCKYILSKLLCETNGLVAGPFAGNMAFVETQDPFGQVARNAAIHHAYSGIEELRLDLPLELEGQKRKLYDQKGERDRAYNPVYLAAFRRKLRDTGIDVDEQVAWHAMQWPTGVTSTRSAPPGMTNQALSSCQVEWRTVSVVDAIIGAHELRNKVSTHRMEHESQFITALEVLSCQNLLRRLVLEKIGCWKGWGREHLRHNAHPGFGC